MSLQYKTDIYRHNGNEHIFMVILHRIESVKMITLKTYIILKQVNPACYQYA